MKIDTQYKIEKKYYKLLTSLPITETTDREKHNIGFIDDWFVLAG